MTHEVIMPALGMTQDTGRLVKWHKEIGEKVLKNEILMEVETDKSTVEVEAGADGFVSQIRADEGSEIPVGEVIAVISADQIKEKVKNVEDRGSIQNDTVVQFELESKREQVEPEKVEIKPAEKLKNTSGDRILASPKARRVANEKSISLEKMRSNGIDEPYFFSDVIEFIKKNENKGRYSGTDQPTIDQSKGSARGLISSEIDDSNFNSMLRDLELLGNEKVVLSCFAAGAFRKATDDFNTQIYVKVMVGDHQSLNFKDPDLTGFQKASERCDEVFDHTTFIIRDISKSYVNMVLSTEVDRPELFVSRKHVNRVGLIVLTLAYNNHDMNSVTAFNFLDGLARRVATPAFHLI